MVDNSVLADKVKTFRKGQIIFREGQDSNEAYIITQGKVSLYRVVNNKRLLIASHGPGHIFGEMGAIIGERRSSNAEATEYTETLVLDQTVLKTMLLKSPRPVQLIAHFLTERVKSLTATLKDLPVSDPFLSVCRILALHYQAMLPGAAQATDDGKTKAPPKNPGLGYAEISRSIREILPISQVEIDAILDRLARLKILEITDVKGAYYRKDDLFGGKVKQSEFVKDRTLRILDLGTFLTVTKNVSQDMQRDVSGPICEMEFVDLEQFSKEVDSTPDIIYKKIAYGEIPQSFFFLHKPSAMSLAKEKGPEFFKRAKRPRLKASDLQSVEDIPGVDNATLQEVFSQLGFHKVAVLVAVAREETREKILNNLSRNIATIVREEARVIGTPDPDEATDVEEELLLRIKTHKGLSL